MENEQDIEEEIDLIAEGPFELDNLDWGEPENEESYEEIKESLEKTQRDIKEGTLKTRAYLKSEFRRELLLPPVLNTPTYLNSYLLTAYVGLPDLAKACMLGEGGIVATLLKIGVEIDEEDAEGRTALNVAVDDALAIEQNFGPRERCCFLLIEGGADVNHKQHDGQTALHKAARHGHIEVLKSLILAGANLSTKGSMGLNAMEIALRRGSKSAILCARMLLSSGTPTTNWNYEWVRTHLDGIMDFEGLFDPDLLQFYQMFLDTSLKHQAREQVRKALARKGVPDLFEEVVQLDVPTHIKSYLLYRT